MVASLSFQLMDNFWVLPEGLGDSSPPCWFASCRVVNLGSRRWRFGCWVANARKDRDCRFAHHLPGITHARSDQIPYVQQIRSHAAAPDAAGACTLGSACRWPRQTNKIFFLFLFFLQLVQNCAATASSSRNEKHSRTWDEEACMHAAAGIDRLVLQNKIKKKNILTFAMRGMYVVRRPLAGTYSTVAIPRPPTTIWVPSGNCALLAYQRPSCNGTFVSTQLQSPSPGHGANVLICIR